MKQYGLLDESKNLSIKILVELLELLLTKDMKSCIEPAVSSNPENIMTHCGATDLSCVKYQI